MRIDVLERHVVAVDVLAPVELEPTPGAEQVLFDELQRRLVLAALAVVIEAGVQRPVVARVDHQVDGVAVPGNRHDLGIIKVVVGTQDALGFLDQAVHVGLTGLEQQLAADDSRLGADVNGVGRTVQPAALALDGRIEDVGCIDIDPADHRMRRLELLGRRHGHGLVRAHWRHERQQQRKAQARRHPVAAADQGRSTVEPTVRRPSRSRCAWATSRNA